MGLLLPFTEVNNIHKNRVKAPSVVLDITRMVCQQSNALINNSLLIL